VHLAHRFLERGADRLGADDFGILVGRQCNIEKLGAFGRSLCRSLTLRDALNKFHSTFSLYSSAERIWWSRETTETAFFLHSYLHKTGGGSRYARHCALLLMRDVIRLAAGQRWQPETVLSPNLEDHSLLREEFCEPKFRQSSVSGFSFPAYLLSVPLNWRRGNVLDACAGDARDDEASDAVSPSSDFLGSMKQVIATLLPEGQCGLVRVAQALGMHPRTLQRRLSELGQDYSELLSRIRFEKTLRLMADPDRRVFDIALELGFQDASNFSRSFRQWTGVTPSQFRKAYQNRN
jgi:AraC-like DNA-binding protein